MFETYKSTAKSTKNKPKQITKPATPAKSYTRNTKVVASKPQPKQNSVVNKQTRAPQTNKPNYQTRKPQQPTKIISTKTYTGKDGNELRIIVLGGLEEVGRNMTLMEYNKEIIIIDMGLQFPEEEMYGIDYIIPNIEYFKDKEDWIKGVIITHGHYDHIGGIPHIMGKIGNPPMFMGKMAAGIVRKRVKEYRECPVLNIKEIDETSKVRLGKNFNIEFLRVNHSIPDCFSIVVKTPLGTIVHTGDFKIDYSPVNDKPADLNRMAEIGKAGVLMLMSDSTDAISPGYQISESAIGQEMFTYFEDVEGRIIIGTFASQLSRVQKLFDIAKKLNRKVCLQGRSMNDNVEIAHGIGYLHFDPKILIESNQINKYKDNQIMIIGTGAQGESNAFLMKAVNGEHRFVKIKNGDTIIFSSSVVPGNERSIQALRDRLVRQGAKVINYKMLDIHAGGHAKQEDLKLMMRLIKPEYFMPIEANHFMLRAHAELAVQVGISENKIFVADNGQVVTFKKVRNQMFGELTKEKVPTDYVMVDGLGVGDVSHIVLRDRKAMAEDGMIVVITTIDSKTGDLIGSPDIISRGFIYMKENRELIQDTRHKVRKIIKDRPKPQAIDEDYIKNKVRNDVGQFLFNKTKRRPMVLPVVIKV